MSQPDDPMSDRQLEQMLRALPDAEPSAALQRAVAEIPLRHPRNVGLLGAHAPWPLRSLWQGVLSAALATLLGLAAGFATADAQPADAAEEDWDALRGLAFATAVDEVAETDEEFEP